MPKNFKACSILRSDLSMPPLSSIPVANASRCMKSTDGLIVSRGFLTRPYVERHRAISQDDTQPDIAHSLGMPA